MITSNLSSSCNSIALRTSCESLTLLRSQCLRPGRAGLAAVYTPYYGSRTICWWRRKQSRYYWASLDSRLERTRCRQYLWEYYHRSTQPISETERTSVSGRRNYSDDKGKKSELEKDHVDRLPKYDDLLRRRVAIWKRLFDEDPYNALFGSSNSALKGKGWQHPLWNSIPRWMQEEFGIQDRNSSNRQDASSSSMASSNLPRNDTTPGNTKKTHEEVAEKESPRVEIPEPGQPQSSYVYDPITGRMVAAHSLPSAEVDSQPQSKHAAPISVKPYNTTQNSHNDSSIDGAEVDRSSAKNFRRKLAHLPENDTDILLPSDIRARIDSLRARTANSKTPTRMEKRNLERAFDQIHAERISKDFKKPDVSLRTILANRRTDTQAFKDAIEHIQHRWSVEDIRRLDDTHYPQRVKSAISMGREPPLAPIFDKSIQSENNYEQYLRGRASIIKTHAKVLQDIRKRMPYDSGMELSKLDDAQNDISQQINSLRKLYHFRIAQARLANMAAERLQLMGSLHLWRCLHLHAQTSPIVDTLARLRHSPRIRTDPLRNLEASLLQHVSARWDCDLSNSMSHDGTNSAEEKVYTGTEGRDIHDMAQSLTFQSKSLTEDVDMTPEENFDPRKTPTREFTQANDTVDEVIDQRSFRAQEDELDLDQRERKFDSVPKSETRSDEDINALRMNESALSPPEPNTLPTEATTASNTTEPDPPLPESSTASVEETTSIDPFAPEISAETAIPSQTRQATYKFIAYDRATKDVVINTLSASSDTATETPIPLHVALSRLGAPSKFLPYVSSHWDVVSSAKNLLVLRTFDDVEVIPPPAAQEESTAPAKPTNHPRINPIDGTTFHLPQAPSGNFASPTGFVNFENPSESVPQPVRRNVEQEETREEDREQGRKEKTRGRRGGGVSRVLVASITGATVCYVVGVAGELVK